MSIMSRKRYSAEFKQEAVNMVLRGGKRPREVAAELGLNENMLYRWRREYLREMDQDAPSLTGKMKPSEMEAENQRLRRELEQIREQRDILKKAIGIFSRDPNRYTNS